MSGEKTILYVNLRTTSGELHFKQFKPDDLCVQIKEWINFCEKVPSFDVTCAGTFPPRILDLDMIEDCRPLKSIFQETNRILLQLKPRGSSMTRERRNHSMNHQSNPSPEEMEQLLYPRMFIEKMPQDNSCLFHAVGYALLSQDIGIADELRSIAAKQVLSDATRYTDAILGQSKSEYVRWILNSNSWGGAIELALFSDYFQTEIVSIDVATLRLDRFGENLNFPSRVFLLYNGVHYDTVTKHLSPKDYVQTIFSTSDEIALAEAVSLAEQLHTSGNYIKHDGGKVRCDTCDEIFIGNMEASMHASVTEHANFSQV